MNPSPQSASASRSVPVDGENNCVEGFSPQWMTMTCNVDTTNSFRISDRESKTDCSAIDCSSTSTWPSITKSSIIPKYNHIFTLFVSLLLSTTLAFFSALDAAVNCTQGTGVWSNDDDDDDQNKYYRRRLDEFYYYYQQQDDDGGLGNGNDDYYDSRLVEAQSCKELFTLTVLPICPIVVVLCAFACRWSLRDDGQWKKNSASSIPESISLTGEEDRDRKRLEDFRAHVQHQARHLVSCYQLFFLSIICVGLWSYAMDTILSQSDEPLLKDDQDEYLFKQHFQSLGAINYVGEVGQNANLYYSTWASLLVSVALFYELGRVTWKHRRTTHSLEIELERITRFNETETNAIEMIITWSKKQQTIIKQKRTEWQHTLYKLRFRTGMWLAALIASVLIYTSSERVWRNSIYPEAEANGDIGDDGTICSIVHGYISLKSRDDMGLIHPSQCETTLAARNTGIACTGLSLLALVAHYKLNSLVHEEIRSSSKLACDSQTMIDEKKRALIPLRMECILATILSLASAINALFATAVDGPAPRVGDLYYSSWVAFIVGMSLTLICLEDILEEQDPDEESFLDGSDSSFEDSVRKRPKVPRWYSINTTFTVKEEVSTRLVMLAPTVSSDPAHDDACESVGSYIGGMPIPQKNSFHQMLEERVIEEEEASRGKRVRRWASGSIFSTFYLMSALDAAFHKSYGELDLVQMYMVICPCIVSIFCLLMFLLCLAPSTYRMVDRFKVGGVVSIFLLLIWIANVILTLHNESSWAVNEIGEVKTANLYYFTWATVLNFGLLMSSYVKKLFHTKQKPMMVVLWLAVVKICFVMFGSCCDILLSVKDQCKAAEHGDTTAVFCGRTSTGAVLGFIGMAVGFFAAVFHYFHPHPSIKAQKAEAIMSGCLTLLFALSLGLITGIGGPGQSVGDLYYGSWLAFLVSLGATTNLYTAIKNQKNLTGSFVCKGSSEEHLNTSCGVETPYSSMDSKMTQDSSHFI